MKGREEKKGDYRTTQKGDLAGIGTVREETGR